LQGIPGSTLDEIEVAISHPMALKQCEQFLKAHNIKQVPEYDTAGAAKIVAEKMVRSQAAVASQLAAEYYKLEILAEDIQSSNINVTRFLVIQKDAPKNIQREKTSIAFKTKHHPGALEECLHALSSNGINLTKIQSRPIPENPWEYVFYADFEGGTDAPHVKKGLRELEDVSRYLKIIGSYPKGNRRVA
jgi:prephenate dehydratase